jgi:hypothetical protein
MKAEIRPIREVLPNAIELDPGKRHVILVEYGTPTAYQRVIREQWKEVFGHEPVIIMCRSTTSVKIFEVDAEDAPSMAQSTSHPGTPKRLGV